MERRDFLRSAVAGLAVGAADAAPQSAAQQPAASGGKKVIAIQIGLVSFMDEGVEKVLDILQQKANVNALFLAVYDFGNGIAGRQLRGHPLPDHGVQDYGTFVGGNYCNVHAQYYKDTVINCLTAGYPEGANLPVHFDTDREVIDAALAIMGTRRPEEARIMHIRNTLQLEELVISEPLLGQAPGSITALGAPFPLTFDAQGNLPAVCPAGQ